MIRQLERAGKEDENPGIQNQSKAKIVRVMCLLLPQANATPTRFKNKLMKRSVRSLLVLLLAVALMPAKAFSQQVDDNQADQALHQKAYKLLETLAEQIGWLQSRENRARLGSNIAMSLWLRNEAKAREMFATVTKEIKAGLEDKDPNRYAAKQHFIKLREDTAVRIGMFDPDGSLQFLNETRPTDVYIRDEEQNELNLRLAIVFASRNPDLSVKLGREALKQGFSQTQLALIYELTKRSRDHASALLAELVKVAPYQDIRHSMEREQFYIMLARLVEPRLGHDPAFRDLMNYFSDLLVEAGCGNKKYRDNDGFCYRMGLVVPFMEKVGAKRVELLKHLGRKGAWPYEWSPEMFQYADVYQNGSVDDLLALTRMFPDFRDVGQGFVIRKVMESGDFERARKLANEFTWKDASDRRIILKQIDDARRQVNEDTSAEIFREAEGLRSEGETFYFLFRTADQIGTKNRQTTLRLLDRASEYVNKGPAEQWQMQWQIGIAVRYCQVKSDRCFTMMEPIVRRMNELVSAAAKLNGFDNRYLADGEWIMTAEGGVGSLLTMMAQNAVYFALSDFDRAIAMSTQFERREIRMMAQLKLAQAVLMGPPKRPLFTDVEQ